MTLNIKIFNFPKISNFEVLAARVNITGSGSNFQAFIFRSDKTINHLVRIQIKKKLFSYIKK